MSLRIAVPFRPGASGGPSIFYRKFREGAEARGVSIQNLPEPGCDAMLAVIAAHPRTLLRARAHRIPIVQRLDGVYYPAIAGNRWRWLNLPAWVTYRFFADRVIFQSEYSRRQVAHFFGESRVPHRIVYNGVDTSLFRPDGERADLDAGQRALTLLSTFRREDELLPVLEAYDLIRAQQPDFGLAVVGRVDGALDHLKAAYPHVEWIGEVANQQLPSFYRGASFLLSSKVRAPCPNIVIESIASGLPVACYDSGSHRELLGDEAGVTAPLDDDFGPLPHLDPHSLAGAALELVDQRNVLAKGARDRALRLFGLEKMVASYLALFEEVSAHEDSDNE